jgi:hypothetical protein
MYARLPALVSFPTRPPHLNIDPKIGLFLSKPLRVVDCAVKVVSSLVKLELAG